MNPGLASLMFEAIHLGVNLFNWLCIGWYTGSPIKSLPVIFFYWFLKRRYWKMGSQFVANVAVGVTIFNFVCGWIIWRDPACIAIGKFQRGQSGPALAVLNHALAADPSSVERRFVRYQLLLHEWDVPGIQANLDELRELGTDQARTMVEMIELDFRQYVDDPDQLAASLNERIKKSPTVKDYLIRGRAHLDAKNLDLAKQDWQFAVAQLQAAPLAKYSWLQSPMGYVEQCYMSAELHLGLSHVHRLQGDLPAARAEIRQALQQFEYGHLARELDPPGAFYFIPGEVITGNQVLAWAVALAKQAGDETEAKNVETRSKTKLKGTRKDLTEFVAKHIAAQSAPTCREQLAAVQSGQEKKPAPQP